MLSESNRSPFYRQIGFDIDALCSTDPEEWGSNLIGLAKVGMSLQPAHIRVWLRSTNIRDWLAFTVIAAWSVHKDEAPELFERGGRLTPTAPDSARLLIGVGVGLAYRMATSWEQIPSERTKKALVKAARETLTGTDRQKLLGNFIRELFTDKPYEKHEGLPVGLLKAVPPAGYGAGLPTADAGEFVLVRARER